MEGLLTTIKSKKRAGIVLILILILTVWLYLFFNVAYTSDTPSALSKLTSPSFDPSSQCSETCLAYKERLYRYCHTSLLDGSENLSSNEGILASDGDQYELVHLHVVARHGDRTPVSKLNLGPKVYHECGLTDGEFNWNELNDFPPPISVTTMQANPLIRLNPGTQSRECADTKGYGLLTALGYKQHANLGKLMSKQYKQFLSNIIANARTLKRDVYLQSTDIPRTAQSLVAFTLGFLPDSQELRQAATIHVSRGTRLESPPVGIDTVYQHCHDYHKLFDDDRRQTGYTASEYKRHYLIDNLCKMFGLSRQCKLLSISKAFEQLAIRGCHQPQDILPCVRTNGPCVKYAQALELFKYIDWAWDNGHPMKSSIIASAAFLNHSVLAPMKKVIDSHITKTESMDVSSGVYKVMISLTHDDTITKLFTSLGIPVKEWIPYASRLVFELWKKKKSSQTSLNDFGVRILFNGKAVTGECGAWTHGMDRELIPFPIFNGFLSTGAYRDLESYNEICHLH